MVTLFSCISYQGHVTIWTNTEPTTEVMDPQNQTKPNSKIQLSSMPQDLVKTCYSQETHRQENTVITIGMLLSNNVFHRAEITHILITFLFLILVRMACSIKQKQGNTYTIGLTTFNEYYIFLSLSL